MVGLRVGKGDRVKDGETGNSGKGLRVGKRGRVRG